MSDLISRADAIEAVAKLQKYDLDERNRLRIYAPWHNPKRIFVETEAIYKTIYKLPSADAVPQLRQTDALIIANALRYLAEDEERNELDRKTAEVLREKILKYGASMCKGGDDE